MTESLFDLNYKTLEYLISVCNIKQDLKKVYQKKTGGIVDLKMNLKPFQRIDLRNTNCIASTFILNSINYIGCTFPYGPGHTLSGRSLSMFNKNSKITLHHFQNFNSFSNIRSWILH